MARFIQENYMEKISLADIAAAGAVGQSKCCKLFARFFFQSPTMYLTYYTETFRKWMGKTPSEFRKAKFSQD